MIHIIFQEGSKELSLFSFLKIWRLRMQKAIDVDPKKWEQYGLLCKLTNTTIREKINDHIDKFIEKYKKLLPKEK